jgi:hypothetical protein
MQPSGDAYPAPLATPTTGPYPPPSPTLIPVDAYPAEDVEPTGTLLAINPPLQTGATTVSGVGPAGITVIVQDITSMGEVLAQTVIGEDGTFTVDVPALEVNTRIGLTTNAGDSVEGGIRPGDGSMNVPQVGYFYDSVMVTP